MFNPGSPDEQLTGDALYATLVNIHGTDTTNWPDAVPETLRTETKSYLLRCKSLCPPQ